MNDDIYFLLETWLKLYQRHAKERWYKDIKGLVENKRRKKAETES